MLLRRHVIHVSEVSHITCRKGEITYRRSGSSGGLRLAGRPHREDIVADMSQLAIIEVAGGSGKAHATLTSAALVAVGLMITIFAIVASYDLDPNEPTSMVAFPL